MKNLLLIAAVLVSALAFAGDQPQITNAKVETRSAANGLEQQVKSIVSQSSPSWIAYAEPVIAGENTMCCFNSSVNVTKGCCGGCKLERDGSSFHGSSTGCSSLEAPTTFFIFLRTANGSIEKARTFSPNCTIDGSGMTVYWLNDVKPTDSIAYLTKLASTDDTNEHKKDISSGAIAAIAMHADPAADVALDKLISTGRTNHIVEQATFWTGNARGTRGYEILSSQLEHNSSHFFRKHAVFALSQNSDPRAQKKLIDLARHDSDSDIRSESLFWLAQEAGTKAAGVISDAIADDPNTDVKKKAVFALSQLPTDEGVPLLIDQAKRNPNPVVRKEAIFWLGQSEDSRALDFIASILER